MRRRPTSRLENAQRVESRKAIKRQGSKRANRLFYDKEIGQTPRRGGRRVTGWKGGRLNKQSNMSSGTVTSQGRSRPTNGLMMRLTETKSTSSAMLTAKPE